MAFRKLTMEQAADLRETRERTGASYEMLGYMFGVNKSVAWSIVQGHTYTRLGRYHTSESPTPHDLLTFTISQAELNVWRRATRPIRAKHATIQRRYAAQNERDGYLKDPTYIAAVREWRGDTAIAAD